MKIYYLILVVVLILSGLGPTSRAVAEEPTGPAGRPVTIPGAEQFDLRSRAGLEYRIFVAGPAGEVPEAGSPVIYLTDGNSNFPVLLAAARHRSGQGPRAVVVGIGYPGDDAESHRERRAHDLTPPTSAEAVASLPGGRYASKSGGNDAFLDFIEGELKPLIERRYKIDRRRQALFGHSFGGLFVLHALFRKPEAFQTYLAASPSIWWNDGSIVGEAEDFLARQAGKPVDARLLITVGARERNPARGPSGAEAKAGGRPRSSMSAQDLAARLARSGIKGFAAEFREFAEFDHGSAILPAAGRGVGFALDGE